MIEVMALNIINFKKLLFLSKKYTLALKIQFKINIKEASKKITKNHWKIIKSYQKTSIRINRILILMQTSKTIFIRRVL